MTNIPLPIDSPAPSQGSLDSAILAKDHATPDSSPDTSFQSLLKSEVTSDPNPPTANPPIAEILENLPASQTLISSGDNLVPNEPTSESPLQTSEELSDHLIPPTIDASEPPEPESTHKPTTILAELLPYFEQAIDQEATEIDEEIVTPPAILPAVVDANETGVATEAQLATVETAILQTTAVETQQPLGPPPPINQRRQPAIKNAETTNSPLPDSTLPKIKIAQPDANIGLEIIEQPGRPIHELTNSQDRIEAHSQIESIPQPDLTGTQAEFSSSQFGAEAPSTNNEISHTPAIRAVTNQSAVSAVAETLIHQVETSSDGKAKSIVLQLHPAELGKVTLQVDWENESLQARIMTNEAATSDLLNQNKQQLIDNLAENGLEFDSLDVAFQDTQDSQENNDEAPPSFLNADGSSPQELVEESDTSGSSGTSMLDIVA